MEEIDPELISGQIDVFSNAGEHVDNVFLTSIILPHEITLQLGKVKSLKGPHYRDVIKVARKLIKGSERKFFFITTLLTEAIIIVSKIINILLFLLLSNLNSFLFFIL